MFDPFGDFDTEGYLRNFEKEKDLENVKIAEHEWFRAQVKGRSQVIKTEVRAMNAQEARWLLWAQWGFHSIQSGPSQIKNQK